MKKAKMNVKGMHCASCELLIKEELEETEGIFDANISQENESAIIKYDETKINESDIKAIIKKEGYEVE